MGYQVVRCCERLAWRHALRIVAMSASSYRYQPAPDRIATIERATGWRKVGIVPWLPSAATLPAEDAASLQDRSHSHASVDAPRIGILRLPHIANFDDFDPLLQEPGLRVDYVHPGAALPGDLTLVIIPGTKATLSDLAFVREQGWDIDIEAHVRRGGRVLGICGGHQILGRRIHDPDGLEGAPGVAQGLGYLDVTTTLLPMKHLRRVQGHCRANGQPFSGYEMHLGLTSGLGAAPSPPMGVLRAATFIACSPARSCAAHSWRISGSLGSCARIRRRWMNPWTRLPACWSGLSISKCWSGLANGHDLVARTSGHARPRVAIAAPRWHSAKLRRVGRLCGNEPR